MQLLRISKPEAEQLLMLIERNLEDGIHTRPERQYWERIRRIKNKLMEVLNVATPNDPKLSDGGAWRGSCEGEAKDSIRAREKGERQ